MGPQLPHIPPRNQGRHRWTQVSNTQTKQPPGHHPIPILMPHYLQRSSCADELEEAETKHACPKVTFPAPSQSRKSHQPVSLGSYRVSKEELLRVQLGTRAQTLAVLHAHFLQLPTLGKHLLHQQSNQGSRASCPPVPLQSPCTCFLSPVPPCLFTESITISSGFKVSRFTGRWVGSVLICSTCCHAAAVLPYAACPASHNK